MAHSFSSIGELGEDYGFRKVHDGKGGYVERDGQLVNPEDLSRRQAMSRGEM